MMPAFFPPPGFGLEAMPNRDAVVNAMVSGTYRWPIGCPPPPAFALASVPPITCWVDFANGNDANGGAERSAARKTIPRLTPGTHVRVIGAYPFKSPDITPIDGAGTAEAPAFVSGENAEFIFNIEVGRWVQSSYIVIDGVKLSGLRVARGGSHHICVRACESTGGFAFAAYDNADLTDLVALANFIHDYGDWQSPTENDRHGFAVGQHVQRCWIVANEATRCGGDGVQVNSGSGFSADQIYVGGNHLHHNRENAWDCKQVIRAVFSENVCTDHWPSSSSPGEDSNIHYNARKVAVLYNRFERACFGLTNTGCDELFVIGNEFADIRHQADAWNPSSNYAEGQGLHFRNCGTSYVYSNTFRRCDAAVRSGSGVATIHMGGNQFEQVGDPPVRLETGKASESPSYAEVAALLLSSMGITLAGLAVDEPVEPEPQPEPQPEPEPEPPIPQPDDDDPPPTGNTFALTLGELAGQADAIQAAAAELTAQLRALRDAANIAKR